MRTAAEVCSPFPLAADTFAAYLHRRNSQESSAGDTPCLRRNLHCITIGTSCNASISAERLHRSCARVSLDVDQCLGKQRIRVVGVLREHGLSRKSLVRLQSVRSVSVRKFGQARLPSKCDVKNVRVIVQISINFYCALRTCSPHTHLPNRLPG